MDALTKLNVQINNWKQVIGTYRSYNSDLTDMFSGQNFSPKILPFDSVAQTTETSVNFCCYLYKFSIDLKITHLSKLPQQ
jgi:hypothetical protein